MWELMGKWVHYTHVVEKVRKHTSRTSWTVTHESIPHPGIGMVIGRRWLPNGNSYQESNFREYTLNSASWMVFEPCGEPTHCYLVVQDDRTNPVRVDPEGVVLLEEFSKFVPVKYLDVVWTQAGKKFDLAE